MPLFVPILRLLMLFLNVYDSYKTLKLPPPSSRNEGRPSVRAMSQRKRDMKGCLAVWIVWCAIALYERLVEGVVYLFIPFYDEIKSLALIFLILTRAKGAEPIYLHLIRPLIKPHTSTLDGALEAALMFGDFIFAVSLYPIQVVQSWWNKKFGKYYEPLDTEQETETDTSDGVASSETPPSVVASSTGAVREDAPATFTRVTRPKPMKPPTIDKPRIDPPSRRSTADNPRNQPPSRRSTHDSARNNPLPTETRDPPASKSTSETTQVRPTASRKSSRIVTQAKPSVPNGDLEPNFLKSMDELKEDADLSSAHQIWYPPKSAYADEANEGDANSAHPPEPPDDETDPLVQQQKELDEWRQYPPFPSAYPATPVAVTSRLVATSMVVSSSLYPPVPEEPVQQDFHQSLLPPREPLNPSPAGDSSDKKFTFRIPPRQPASDSSGMGEADESMSVSNSDEEDEFNITLRTPMPPSGTLRFLPRPSRLASAISGTSSIPTRTSVLTSADHGSLRTSISSDSMVLSPTLSNGEPTSPVIGRKRTLMQVSNLELRHRVRDVDQFMISSPSEASSASDADERAGKRPTNDTIVRLEISDSSDQDSLSGNAGAQAQGLGADANTEESEPEEKRRRVTRSGARPRAQKDVDRIVTRRRDVLLPKTKSSSRTTGGSAGIRKTVSSASSVSDSLPPPPVPPKAPMRTMTRRK